MPLSVGDKLEPYEILQPIVTVARWTSSPCERNRSSNPEKVIKRNEPFLMSHHTVRTLDQLQPSRPTNHARPASQSLFRVATDIPRTSAASFSVKPPKYRNSIT